MKINYRRIYRSIHLSDYFGDGNETIEVWANPPRKLREEWERISLENEKVVEAIASFAADGDKPVDSEEGEAILARSQEMNMVTAEWFSQIWKFEGEHPSVEEVATFIQEVNERDPDLYFFLIISTWEVINDQRRMLKKG